MQHSAGSDPWCKFNDHMLQLFTSCLFLAGGVAAIVGSWTCKRWVGAAGRLYWACGWLAGWGMQVVRKVVSTRTAGLLAASTLGTAGRLSITGTHKQLLAADTATPWRLCTVACAQVWPQGHNDGGRRLLPDWHSPGHSGCPHGHAGAGAHRAGYRRRFCHPGGLQDSQSVVLCVEGGAVCWGASWPPQCRFTPFSCRAFGGKE